MPPGYRDLDRPPLHEPSLRRALVRPGSLWTQVRVVAETGSTNADVTALAAAGVGEGMVLVAESQSLGRGRLGRSWVSPPQAGLTFSVLLRPPPPRDRWGWLPLVAGMAVTTAVQELAEVETVLKWPNDVQAGVQRRKLAGVLAEVCGDAVALGVGLNVTTRPEELPTEVATSLFVEGAACADRAPILVATLRRLADGYREWLGGADIRPAYLQMCDTVGRYVCVAQYSGADISGEAVDIDAAGCLVVVGAEKTRRAIPAGDVTNLTVSEP